MKAGKLQIFIASALVVSVLAFGATPALAGKGGKPGSGGSTSGGSSCSVTPNPVAASAPFVISGRYGPNQYLTLAITSGGGTSFVWTQADANGNLSKTWQVHTRGSNSIKVHNSSNNAVLGTCSFSTY